MGEAHDMYSRPRIIGGQIEWEDYNPFDGDLDGNWGALEEAEEKQVVGLPLTREEKERIANARREAVKQAVRSGKLVRPLSCEECGKTARVQGHHSSYRREGRLKVMWLCPECHGKKPPGDY